jgi:DNA-3-methyladenine glycosylase II
MPFFLPTSKKGKKKGLRKWIIMSYGADPSNTSEKEFQKLIKNWHGFEAAALEFLFVNWIVGQKKRSRVNPDLTLYFGP